MDARPTVNVIGPSYAYGLAHDARLLVDALNDAGFDAVFVNAGFSRGMGPLDKIKARIFRTGQWLCYRFLGGRFAKRDVNLFVERISPHLFKRPVGRFYFPIREWFPMFARKYLKNFDRIVCKTHHAEEIFLKLGYPTGYASFTSTDRRTLPPPPKSREFLMIAANRQGIPDRVLKVWARHPEWPRLTVTGRHIPAELDLPNVTVIREFISEEAITRLQNSCLFHVCVTAAEGFGHKLNEALSCGGIVLATDGPPMNEIIQPDRGVLVRWDRTNPMGLGAEFHFDEADLERAVERCLKLTEAEIAMLSRNARSWFEENDRTFRRLLKKELLGLLEE